MISKNFNYQHIPVMLEEVLEYLDPKLGENFIDCTLGGGGYSKAILERIGKKGKLISIDLDKLAINNFLEKYQRYSNIYLVEDNFINLKSIVQKFRTEFNLNNRFLFDGIVLDLGLSSAHLDDKQRGISFQNDANLDMRFGDTIDENKTKEIINNYNQKDLEEVIFNYGEERWAKRIAEFIVKRRKEQKICTVFQLLKIIKEAIPPKFHNKKIHFATKTFQALRIATNMELENLKKVLPQAVEWLKKGGKLAVVSYHSLEDRIVKNFFRKESSNCICSKEVYFCTCQHEKKIRLINKKVIKPSFQEIKDNFRSRSAKLRVVEHI